VRKKETVVIHVDLERAAMGEESGGEEVEVGEEEFALLR
jgi:hypothetical protein